jgi:hypothetical protein
MLDKIKKLFEFSAKNGLYFPAAYDINTKKPSTTLFSFYTGIGLAVISLIAYHIAPDKLIGPASMSLLYLGMTFVFYRVRAIDRVKINVEQKSIEFEDLPENGTKKDL